MEPEVLIPHSQQPATCSYSEWCQSTPCPPSQFLNIYSNNILQCTPGSSSWTLSQRFLHQNPVTISHLPHTYCMVHPSHSYWFHQPNTFGGQYISLGSSLYCLLHCPANSSLLDANMLFSTLFSNTLSLYNSPWMWQTKFHTHTKQQA